VRRLRKQSAILTALATVAAVGALTAVTLTAFVARPTPALALENGLARTPPMGFNNWNFTRCGDTFNETLVKGIADAFVQHGLRELGYQYVNIDDCWARPKPGSASDTTQTGRDANGNLVPDPARFPSGIKALADYIHARGLKFGIYTSAGTKTCNTLGFSGGLGHEQQDANLFASWGVDYLKYDNCNNQGVDAQTRYKAMRDALRNTGRPIVYSIVEWGRTGPPKVWEWGADVGNMWRTTGDISANWTSMINITHFNDDLAQFAGPGHWNDADMLQVGNGSLTDNEDRTHFSLWAMMASPLLIGTNIINPTANTLNVLRNADVIAIDQDPLGRQGTIVSSSSGRVVYNKVLANGDRAVLLLNETDAAATVSTTTSAIGMGGGSVTLFDLWSKSRRTTSSSISASVPSHGVVMYRVSRPTPGNRFEAENAVINQGVVATNHVGFSGTGFVDYNNVVGSSVEWTVNAAQAGAGRLTIQYANGSTANRPMDIAVNGTVVMPGQAFNPTGNWDTWANATVTAPLNAGANTVRATATTASGGPNVDFLEIAVAPPPGEFQAEDAAITMGVVESNHLGFTGTGFVNTDNVVGSGVTWTVNAATAGPATVSIRFSNGTTTNRPMDVAVNGTVTVPGQAFNSTTNWDTWATVTLNLTLDAGANTIRVTATTASGGPNLDRLTLG
jgi:alpha-galactosidase